jgi:RNA polymerase sigma-70 factor (ECF subfamily)
MPATPFPHLLAAYRPRALRAALGWLGDEQEAHEAAQDALLRAWAARNRYDPARPFYPWLHTIVRNTCRDRRARQRHAAAPGLQSDRVLEPRRGPDVLAEVSQAEARLRAGLSTLSESHRQIIVMRHFEDLSYAEIGEVLDAAPGTVMSRLFRARRALASAIQALETPP